MVRSGDRRRRPAGLAAALYGASEGLDTHAIDAVAFGGQAGTSSRIENYLGFPTGISGSELAARARVACEKVGRPPRGARRGGGLASGGLPTYGVQLAALEVVNGLDLASSPPGPVPQARPVPYLERYEGVGVYYAAPMPRRRRCWRGPGARIVGGGNSAGQRPRFSSPTPPPAAAC